MSYAPHCWGFGLERNRFLSSNERWFWSARNQRVFRAPEIDEYGRRLIPPIDLNNSIVDLGTLDAFIAEKAEKTRKILHVAMGTGALTVQDTRVLEFGPGNGGSTVALQQMLSNAAAAGAKVSLEAVEINPGLADDIVEAGILPANDMHVGDGFGFMGRTQNTGQYNLIFASWPGPFYDDGIGKDFVQAAESALSPDGYLILATDPRTLGHIVAGCEVIGMPHIVTNGTEVGAEPTENILIAQKIPELV